MQQLVPLIFRFIIFGHAFRKLRVWVMMHTQVFCRSAKRGDSRLVVAGPSDGGLGPEVNDALLAAFDRADMTLPRLLTFAAHFYLALWLLMAGRSCRMAWIRAISRGLDTISTWRPLVFLGQHSLPVYAWHVLLCYGLAIFAADKVNEAAWYWREGVVVLATLTLFVPAILDARKPWAIARSRDAGPRPATAQS